MVFILVSHLYLYPSWWFQSLWKHMKVSWDDEMPYYSHYLEKKEFQTTNQHLVQKLDSRVNADINYDILWYVPNSWTKPHQEKANQSTQKASQPGCSKPKSKPKHVDPKGSTGCRDSLPFSNSYSSSQRVPKLLPGMEKTTRGAT